MSCPTASFLVHRTPTDGDCDLDRQESEMENLGWQLHDCSDLALTPHSSLFTRHFALSTFQLASEASTSVAHVYPSTGLIYCSHLQLSSTALGLLSCPIQVTQRVSVASHASIRSNRSHRSLVLSINIQPGHGCSCCLLDAEVPTTVIT